MKNISAPVTLFMSLLVGIVNAQVPWMHADRNASQNDVFVNPASGDSYALMMLSFDNDGGINTINAVPSYQCNQAITPSVVMENFGDNILTSAIIEYTLDDGTPSYYQWTGLLNPGEADTITLPTLIASAGSHELHVQITEANGSDDTNGSNNKSIDFNIIGSSVRAPFTEKFETSILPPGFFIDNPDGGPTWQVFDFPKNGDDHGYAMQMLFYNTKSLYHSTDDLFLQNLDLTNLTQAMMTFDLAYTYYSDTYYDELKIEVSSDCGASWAKVYDKQKNELQTAEVSDVFFVPKPEEWRQETIDLSNYVGNSNVLIRFEAINGFGNNLYIDNIEVSSATGVSDPHNTFAKIDAYPNPANENVSIHSINNDMSLTSAELQILNELGQRMLIIRNPSTTVQVDTGHWPNGIYEVSLINNGMLIGKKKLEVIH